MNSQPLLTLRGISFERDERLLFAGVDIDVAAGDILQLSGANGSGKTTLLKIINGTLSPLSGERLWRGQPIYKCAVEYAANLLYIGHQTGIKSTLTAEENLRWLHRIHPTKNSVTVSQALARMGLQGYQDVPCHSLSEGQQRRVALARLYSSAARLWVLDEPFAAIDKTGIKDLEALLKSHAENGGAVVLTTHQPLSIDSQTLHLGAL